jgi:hypothetical protein
MGNGKEYENDVEVFDDYDRCVCGEDLHFDRELGFLCLNPLCPSHFEIYKEEY